MKGQIIVYTPSTETDSKIYKGGIDSQGNTKAPLQTLNVLSYNGNGGGFGSYQFLCNETINSAIINSGTFYVDFKVDTSLLS